jgi:hypothetical protein
MGETPTNAKMKDEPSDMADEKSDTATEVECTTTDYVSEVDDLEAPRSRRQAKSPARNWGKEEADADESTVTSSFFLPLYSLGMQSYIHTRPHQLRTALLNFPRVCDKDRTAGFVRPPQLPLLHCVLPKPLTPPNNTHGELIRLEREENSPEFSHHQHRRRPQRPSQTSRPES